HSLTALKDALEASKQPNVAPFPASLSEPSLPFSVDDVATSAKSVPLAEGEALVNEMAVRIPERRAKAIEKLEALVADEKTETAVAHRALAWAHVQKGETDRAFEELTDAMRLNSSDPWVRMGLALAAYHSGERGAKVQGRSEEHTSELQSRSDLVCRLLLEKKNGKLQYKTGSPD